MSRGLAFPVLVVLALAAACSGQTSNRDAAPAASRIPSRVHVNCPTEVLQRASLNAPVAEVLGAAERLLSRRTINSQGRIYRLTPRRAPIDVVERIAADSLYSKATFGLLVLRSVAARQCGETTAQASWAIHYSMPYSVISSAGGYHFLVKTRGGWRFWGDWCGVGRPGDERRMVCIY